MLYKRDRNAFELAQNAFPVCQLTQIYICMLKANANDATTFSQRESTKIKTFPFSIQFHSVQSIECLRICIFRVITFVFMKETRECWKYTISAFAKHIKNTKSHKYGYEFRPRNPMRCNAMEWEWQCSRKY